MLMVGCGHREVLWGTWRRVCGASGLWALSNGGPHQDGGLTYKQTHRRVTEQTKAESLYDTWWDTHGLTHSRPPCWSQYPWTDPLGTPMSGGTGLPSSKRPMSFVDWWVPGCGAAWGDRC